jgi:chromosome segregation ATPase
MRVLSNSTLPVFFSAISKIAEEVCDSQVDLQDMAGKSPGTDRIWTSLLMLTSTKARPLPKDLHRDDSDSRMTPARLKLYVLSNLLDCAVQSPNMQRRRQYIEKIMGLNKSVQKTLMSLIERRGKSTPKKRSPSRGIGSSSMTPPKSALRQRRSLLETPRSEAERSPQPPQSTNSGRSYPIEQSDSNTSMATPIQSNLSPERSSSRKTNDSIRSSGYTPDASRRVMSPYTENTMPSPGTFESPGRMQMVFRELHSRIVKYESYMVTYKQREQKLQGKLEMIEGRHRNEMMKLEKQSLDREEELIAKYKEHVEALNNQLHDIRDKASRGEQAIKELQKAKEEIEVLNQNQGALPELSEKLRKYKERMNELQDIKDALRREQEAHGNAVDEIVRLESELQTLAPLKRQLEDYKVRAIEAEVKLVETQDALEKLEKKANDQSSVNESLWKGAMLQKEQMDELRRRLQEDAKAQSEPTSGVGEGINELNPEVMEELYRLRNENKKLREFAEKRSNDSVQKMADTLDDTKRLGDKYKKEYLSTKDKLEKALQTLYQSEERERKLVAELNNVSRELADLQHAKSEVDEHCRTLEQKLSATAQSLSDSEQRNADLHRDVDQWTEKHNTVEAKASEHSARINELGSEIAQVTSELARSSKTVSELQELLAISEEKLSGLHRTNVDLESQLEDVGQKLQQSEKDHQVAQTQASSLRSEIENLLEENANQKKSIDELRKARQEVTDEAHRALEATREVLEAKAKKDIDDLQKTMNRLLEEERKAHCKTKEDSESKLLATESKWKMEYNDLQERSTSSLNQYRENSQERIESLQREYEEQIERMKEGAKEDKEKLVRKGKAMIAEAKNQAKQELDALFEKNQQLDAYLKKLKMEKESEHEMLEGKIASLKNHLEFSTAQVNELTIEVDTCQEKMRSLERENFDLQEDNDRCRRQLRGTGGGGQFQSQLEKLQKEYSLLLEENRELKKASRYSHAIGVIPESVMSEYDEDEQHNYGRSGGMTNEKLKEIKFEYDAHISNLVDEKRELLMKNYSASIDVEKAERRAAEKDELIAQLNEEITSLKLQIQRQELTNDDTVLRDALQHDLREENELDIFDNQYRGQEMLDGLPPRTPPKNALKPREDNSPRHRKTGIPTVKPSKPDTSFLLSRTSNPASPGNFFESDPRQRSPSLMKAMKEKQEYELELRQRLQSLTKTSKSPPRVTFKEPLPSENVLAPTQKHEQQSNRPDEAVKESFVTNSVHQDNASMSQNNEPSTSFGIGADYQPLRKRTAYKDAGESEAKDTSNARMSLMDYTQVNNERRNDDERPECKQS